MAVIQISRIQIRRGQKNQGSGIPQLAGGELGWAMDSQELFIGNGSVAEGAPLVGNTKILTENDNLFEPDCEIHTFDFGDYAEGAKQAGGNIIYHRQGLANADRLMTLTILS